jgi:hypothetical protein
VTPGFFLPKPDVWTYFGTRAITGPYQDGLSSETFPAGAPTPATTDGLLNPPPPDSCGTNAPDCAVFFKAFSGDATNGPAHVDLFQDNPATPGVKYVLSGWAGAEANFDGDAHIAIDFLNAANTVIPGGSDLLLNTNGLFVPNGQSFNYKQYSVSATAPAGAVAIRARISMLNGIPNPLGGGQAFVADDFTLQGVPEPATAVLGMLGLVGFVGLVRRR